jgi:hypothetical protein
MLSLHDDYLLAPSPPLSLCTFALAAGVRHYTPQDTNRLHKMTFPTIVGHKRSKQRHNVFDQIQALTI